MRSDRWKGSQYPPLAERLFHSFINGPLQVIVDYFQEIEPVYLSRFSPLLTSHEKT